MIHIATVNSFLLLNVLCTLSLAIVTGTQHKLLIFFPGVGFDEGRTELVMQNLKFIEASRSKGLDISCLLSMYRKPSANILYRVEDICSVTYYPTGNYVAYLKTVEPRIVQFAGYTHIMILLDDVELEQSSFSFQTILRIMDTNGLMVASPRVEGAHCPTMHRNQEYNVPSLPNAVGHESEVKEEITTVLYSTIHLSLSSFSSLMLFVCVRLWRYLPPYLLFRGGAAGMT